MLLLSLVEGDTGRVAEHHSRVHRKWPSETWATSDSLFLPQLHAFFDALQERVRLLSGLR